MDSTHYDVIIVGAGPAGLAFGQCALIQGKSVLVLESHPHAIGGCHRVHRVRGYFTEHGPRIYSSAYTTFKSLLHQVGLSFEDLFVPYTFQLSNIGTRGLFSFRIFEINAFAQAFLRLVFNEGYGQDISMKDFGQEYGFTPATMEYIDRLCRLTDGAGSDRYTLNEFLSLVNEQALYTLRQPKLPNDVGLFRVWTEALGRRGMHIKLNTQVKEIQRLSGNQGFVVNGEYTGGIVVLAMPPVSLVDLLRNISDPHIRDNFGDLRELSAFANASKYIEYISMTFHWDSKLILPKIWGFPASEWGIAFIVLSDYMTFTEPNSKTVISLAVTYQHKMSSVLHKTAAECASVQELTRESLRQLRDVYPDLPQPTLMMMSPDVYYTDDAAGKPAWINKNNAFVYSSRSLSPVGKTIKGLYSLGTHNMKSKYSFTSLESAVENAVDLANRVFRPPVPFPLPGPVKLTDLLRALLALVVVIGVVVAIQNVT